MLSYGDDENRYQWKQYDLGNLVCHGKQGVYPSQEKGQQLYSELKQDIDCIESELEEINVNLDDVQERNFAFRYRVGDSSQAVKTGEIVKFNIHMYGGGVNNGIYTKVNSK